MLKSYKAMAERLKSDAGRLKNRVERLKSDAGKAIKRWLKGLKIIFQESSCGAVRSVDAAVLGVLR